MVISIIVIALSVIFDQVTKFLAVRHLYGNEPVDVIDGVFRFSYVENRGAAFGMLGEHRWVFMVISTVAIVGLLVYLFKFAPKNRLLSIGLSLVVGGGIGNMIDRIRLGYVVDFLTTEFMDFPIFNVADIFVTLGCICLAVYMIFIDKTIFREQKAAVEVKENDVLLNRAVSEITNQTNYPLMFYKMSLLFPYHDI